MGKNIRYIFFIMIAFLLGSIAMMYVNLFNILILGGILLNFCIARKEFIANMRSSGLFLKLPLFILLYLGIHTLVLKVLGTGSVKYSYSIFEALLLYFLGIPLYICSVKDILDRMLLKYSLLAFVGGVMCFNLVAFFSLTGAALFQDPVVAISQLSASRFGGNKEILGNFVFLEPQALYISMAALIVFYFTMVSKLWKQRGICLLLFFILLFFLSLTETKSAFLAFSAGMIIMLVYFLKRRTLKYKLGVVGVVVVLAILSFIFVPASLKQRLQLAKTELNDVLNNDLKQGGTIVPRVALYKTNLSHLNEFGVWGLGVAYSNTVKQWYNDSVSVTNGLTDPHNSFMYFWLVGGIPGLLFVLGLFVLPLWRMFRNKQFSFFVLALWVAMLIVNNTTVLLSLNDSRPLILFFLSLLYWKGELFWQWEKKD